MILSVLCVPPKAKDLRFMLIGGRDCVSVQSQFDDFLLLQGEAMGKSILCLNEHRPGISEVVLLGEFFVYNNDNVLGSCKSNYQLHFFIQSAFQLLKVNRENHELNVVLRDVSKIQQNMILKWFCICVYMYNNHHLLPGNRFYLHSIQFGNCNQ